MDELERPPADLAGQWADKSIAGGSLSKSEARSVLSWPDDQFPGLLAAAYRVRRHFFGRTMRLNFLANIQSGLCSEDCAYCSQSKISEAPIDKYPLWSTTEMLKAAEQAVRLKAARLCLVASGRGPGERIVQDVAAAVKKIKEKHPRLEICCCLGQINDAQAIALSSAGVSAYNHNLNTSEDFYGTICSTHTYAERRETVKRARQAGLSPCCGALFGMGESDDDIVNVAFALRDLQADSIPINFLMPIAGTPMAGVNRLTPLKCLKILCLFRFISPRSELRISGGREIHLKSLQPLGLYIANSIFIGDYLTTQGQAPAQDLEMIHALGFEIEGQTSVELSMESHEPAVLSTSRPV